MGLVSSSVVLYTDAVATARVKLATKTIFSPVCNYRKCLR